MNKQALYERYMQLDWPQQLGNLASTLARISTRASSAQYDALVADLLREAALFIEWSAKAVPPALLLDLAPLQRELVLWHRVWPQETKSCWTAAKGGWPAFSLCPPRKARKSS